MESGEGIERLSTDADIRFVRPWNPVKELKGADGLYHEHRCAPSVESGEGIESCLGCGRIVGKLPGGIR